MKNVDKLIGLKEPMTRQQGERKKKHTHTMGLAGKITTLHVHHTSLYMHFYFMYLPSLHDYDMKLPIVTFTQTSNDEILFLFLNLDIVP